eukprot:TRINITY_DN2183_c0_g2_i2.p1 TRINITY_DN2183_c0_g2~~TRINITY_DN2183_c0_g2_i2.p1  ORF type:complete len:831 (+),score=262.84 TRINITY_DN2183_c0_g2_i2:72-2564(+)
MQSNVNYELMQNQGKTAAAAEEPKKYPFLGRIEAPESDSDSDDENESYLPDTLAEGNLIKFPFPACAGWIPTLFKQPSKQLAQDIIAGITVGSILIPSTLATAMLAGIPSKSIYIMLYASLLPIFFYALFGTSKHLVVGPITIGAIMVGDMFTDLKIPLGDDRLMYIEIMTLMVGVILLILGLLKTSFLDNIMSRPVISGYLTAVAILVITDQIFKICLQRGLPTEAHYTVLDKIGLLIKSWGDANYMSIVLAAIGASLLFVFNYLRTYYYPENIFLQSAPLIVSFFGATICYWLNMNAEYGVKLIQEIPRAIPYPEFPKPIKFSILIDMIPYAIIIALFGYIESVAIARAYAVKKKYMIDPAMELKAFGIVNIIGSFFKSLPTFGSLSRTPTNVFAGANTQLSGIACSIFVIFVIVAAAEALMLIPMCIISAIVVYSLFEIIDFKTPIFLWKYHRNDFAIWAVAVIGTLLFDVGRGLLLCIGCCLLLVLKFSALPSFHFQNFQKDTALFSSRDLLRLVEREVKNPGQSRYNALNVEGTPMASAKIVNAIGESLVSGAIQPDSFKRASMLIGGPVGALNARKRNTLNLAALGKGEEFKRKTKMFMQEIINSDHLTYYDVCLCLDTDCKKRCHVVVLALDKALHFASCNSLRSMLEPVKVYAIEKHGEVFGLHKNILGVVPAVAEMTETYLIGHTTLPGPTIKAIILDASRLKYVDYSAIQSLKEMIHGFHAVGVEVRLSDLKDELYPIFVAHEIDGMVMKEAKRPTINVIYATLAHILHIKKDKKISIIKSIIGEEQNIVRKLCCIDLIDILLRTIDANFHRSTCNDFSY